MIAFIGMGLLGSNFAQALLKRGEALQVWNRTSSKAEALEQFGAKAFLNVEDAVAGADLIHLTLRDDATVNEILLKAAPGLKKGAIIIDHTTTSKEGAIVRTQQWKAKGHLYQHAPVFMGPPNALDATGTMLVSGDQELIAKLESHLSKMTGKLMNFGDEPGRAAAMKLIGNAFLVTFTAGIADTIKLAKALDTPITEVKTLFDTWNPAAMLPARLKRMTSDDFSKPSWELSMARKDTGLFIAAAQQAGIPLTVIPAVAGLMDSWIDKGFGNHDWTVIAK